MKRALLGPALLALACASGPRTRDIPLDPPCRVRICSTTTGFGGFGDGGGCVTLSVSGETENGDPVLLRVPEHDTVDMEECGL